MQINQNQNQEEDVLQRYGIDLTKKAEEHKIDPVIGRDDEIRNVVRAQERIIIMPGCGVNPDNARDITEKSGAKEIHASCRSVFASTMKFRHEGVQMGKPDADEYAIKDTDVEIVRQLRQNLDMQ